MNCRRQALQLCLNLAVVVVIEILYEFLFAVLHGLRLLQIQQFTLEQTKETLNHGIAPDGSVKSYAQNCLRLW